MPSDSATVLEPTTNGDTPKPDAKPTGDRVSGIISGWVVGLIFGAIAIGSASEHYPELSEWALSRWPVLLGIYIALGAAAIAALHIRVMNEALSRVSQATRNRITALLVPLVILMVFAISYGRPALQAAAIQGIFAFIFCLLPGAMYYLFIVSRRPSMLNEYVANLERLGLIGKLTNDSESDQMRSTRIESYLQRFEAVYGTIDNRDELRDALTGGESMAGRHSAATIAYGSRRPELAHAFPHDVFVQLILTTIILAVGWLLVLEPLKPWFDPTAAAADAVQRTPTLVPALTPVNVAFIGAYFFIIQMIFRRFVRHDLSAKVYVHACIRIILAILAAWIVAIAWTILSSQDQPVGAVLLAGVDESAASPTLLILAFICGVFPRTLWQLVTSLASKIWLVPIALPSLLSDQPLSELDGITVWHESRFEEEDIDGITSLATADVLELLLQTRFPPERLMNWIDQAVLLAHVAEPPRDRRNKETVRARLRQAGISTATDALIFAIVGPAQQEEALGKELSPALRQVVSSLITRRANFTLLRAWYQIEIETAIEAPEEGADPYHQGTLRMRLRAAQSDPRAVAMA